MDAGKYCRWMPAMLLVLAACGGRPLPCGGTTGPLVGASGPEEYAVSDAGLPDLELGTGFDPRTGTPIAASSCVEVVAVPLDGAPGAWSRQRLSLHYARSVSELAKRLQVDLAFRMNSTAASAAITANALSTMSTTRESNYLAFDARVVTGQRRVATVRFKSKEVEALFLTNPTQFRNQCGAGYVSVVEKGGIFRAIYASEQEAFESVVESALGLRGNYAAYSTDVGVREKVARMSQQESLDVSLVQQGGAPVRAKKRPSEALEDALSYSTNFEAAVAAGTQKAGVVGYQVTDYSRVPLSYSSENCFSSSMISYLNAVAARFSDADEALREAQAGETVLVGPLKGVSGCGEVREAASMRVESLVALKQELGNLFGRCASGGGCSAPIPRLPREPDVDSSNCKVPGCQKRDSVGFCNLCAIPGGFAPSVESSCLGMRPGTLTTVVVNGAQEVEHPEHKLCWEASREASVSTGLLEISRTANLSDKMRRYDKMLHTRVFPVSADIVGVTSRAGKADVKVTAVSATAAGCADTNVVAGESKIRLSGGYVCQGVGCPVR